MAKVNNLSFQDAFFPTRPPNSCYINNVIYPQENYSRYTFALCFWAMAFIHTENHDGRIRADKKTHEVVFKETSSIQPGSRLSGDVSHETISSLNDMCRNLSIPGDLCSGLKTCLKMASDCCQSQLAESTNIAEGFCPSTWDGVACFQKHSNNSEASVPCPDSFILRHGNVTKQCYQNGLWNERTFYQNCVQIAYQHYEVLHTVGNVCKIITISAVIPACLIMLCFRALRQQQRIRIHLGLLLASLMVAVSTGLWSFLVHRSILWGERPFVTERNPVWCRLIHLSEKFSFMAFFMWMFIEFYHLHRLLMNSFSAPQSVRCYYIYGFGFPLVLTVIYGTIRATDKKLSERCMENFSLLHWIYNGPNIVTLALNVILMIRIVNVLLRQLVPLPNEPSSFRRAVRAVMILMPSLGVQYVLFMWTRPEGYSVLRTVHDVLKEILCSLHGALIAFVFCYLNREVRSILKIPCLYLRRRLTRRSFTTSSSTQRRPETNCSLKEERGGREKTHRLEAEPANGKLDETWVPLNQAPSPKISSKHGGNGYSCELEGRPNGDNFLNDTEVTEVDPEGQGY